MPSRACRRSRRAAREQLGARLDAVQRHRLLGGVRRRRAARRGDVVEQRVVGVVADRGDHRHRQQRDRAAEQLVGEREQVGRRAAAAGDDDHLDLAARRELAQRRPDPRRRVAVLHRRVGPDDAARPAAALERRDADPRRALPLFAQTIPIVRGSSARAQRALAVEQAVGGERLAAALDLREQVALAGDAERRDREAERGRRARAAGVVVAAALDDHLRAVGERLRDRRPSRSQSLRHIAQGIAPSASRSSK